jgi:hypothetical protein
MEEKQYKQERLEEIIVRFNIPRKYSYDGILLFPDEKTKSLIMHICDVEFSLKDVKGWIRNIQIETKCDHTYGFCGGWIGIMDQADGKLTPPPDNMQPSSIRKELTEARAELKAMAEVVKECKRGVKLANSSYHDKDTELKRLREWIEENAEHDADCPDYEVPVQPCTCGLTELLTKGAE